MKSAVLALTFVGVSVASAPWAAAQDPSDAIYDESRLTTYTLTLSPTDWNKIVNDPTGQGDQWQRANMTWTNGSVTETVVGVGVKRSGKYSQAIITPKPPIRISFNEFEFDAPKRKWRGVNRIKLDSMIGNTDVTMMRDRLGYWTFRQFGAPASRASHGRLYVNGAYKGLYTVEEPVKEPFARYRWGEDDGNLYEVDLAARYHYEWLGPTPATYVPSRFIPENNYPGGDYRDVVQLVNILNNFPTNQVASLLNGRINLDAFYNHVACLTVIGDGDGLAHGAGIGSGNHWWYHRAATNKLEIIKWDPGASQGWTATTSPFPKGEYPLFYRFDTVSLTRWLVNDPAANAAVRTKIRNIINGSYATNVLARIDTIYNQIRAAAYADSLKGISTYSPPPVPADPNGFTNAEFDAARNWLKDWYNRRFAYLRSRVGTGGTNGAQFISQTVPTSMTAGQTYSVSVTMKNTGTTTWTESAYKLGSQNPPDNATWGMNRVSMIGSVAPGQNKTFTWNVTAPATAGTRNFQWRMNQSGAGWFGALTTNVAVAVTSGGSTVTTSFQDGVSPSASYAGTRDTYLSQDAPTTNYGTAPTVGVDGDTASNGHDLSALLKWDVTAIPPGRTVQSARITLYVTNLSTQTYEFYRLGRAWTETGATWNQYASGSPWATAGAQGSADRGATVRGTITASATGAVTITLNSLGVSLVQSWVNSPSANFGLILVDSANVDSMWFASRQATTASQRPRLQVTYSSTAAAAVLASVEEAPGDGAETPLADEDAITSPGEDDAFSGGESSDSCGALGVEWVVSLILLGIPRRIRRRR